MHESSLCWDAVTSRKVSFRVASDKAESLRIDRSSLGHSGLGDCDSGQDREHMNSETRYTFLFPLPTPFHRDLLCERHWASC